MDKSQRRYIADKTVEVVIAALSAPSNATKPVVARPEEVKTLLQTTYDKLSEIYGF